VRIGWSAVSISCTSADGITSRVGVAHPFTCVGDISAMWSFATIVSCVRHLRKLSTQTYPVCVSLQPRTYLIHAGTSALFDRLQRMFTNECARASTVRHKWLSLSLLLLPHQSYVSCIMPIHLIAPRVQGVVSLFEWIFHYFWPVSK
jgi:hypothetical protein